MGYDLHITRREDWAESEVPDIPLDEWLAYVRSDSELDLTASCDVKEGMELEFQNQPGYCEWNAHPTMNRPSARTWFSYRNGCIYTKNPDASTIRKMIKMASALNAKVQGDDGEIYNEAYGAEMESIQKPNASPMRGARKAWWKFW